MNKKQVKKIISDLESGYDQMADKFSETRKFFWRDFDFIAKYIKNKDKVLDFGCGNGRFLELLKNKKVDYAGVDISEKLLKLARKKYKNKHINFRKTSGFKRLPFPDNYFNVIVSVAVFHHFPEEYARNTASELFRILKPKGRLIVTVWNLKQRRFKKFRKGKSKNLHIPFKNNDMKEYFQRFHHLYTKKDLEIIFSTAGFKTEKTALLKEMNIFYSGLKPK